MKTGVMSMNTDQDGVAPLDLARMVEDNGIESIWLTDHSHVPVTSRVPEGMEAGYADGRPEPIEERYRRGPGGLPWEYYRHYDPLTTIAAMGAVTSTLKLATGICLVVQRDPFYLAKQVASIDHFTGGRFIFGVGAGADWNGQELRNHGVNLKSRTQLMLERIDAMKQIWSEDQAEFHGEQVDFDPIYSWPKPVTKPHPPIIMGGHGPKVLDRALSHADGWFPGHGSSPFSNSMFEQTCERIQELRERAAALGRTVDVTLNWGQPQLAEQYAESGLIDRVVYVLPAGKDAIETKTAVKEFGRLADLVRDVTP